MSEKTMPWFVRYEVRPRGAIGLFASKAMSVSASSEEDALKQVFDALHEEGWETRFPLEAYQYEENEQ